MSQPVTTAAIAVALILATQNAAAQVFTCTVGDRKVYQSTPCQAGDRPVDMNVPAPADRPANHRISEENRRWLEERERKSQRAGRVLGQRAAEARSSRLQREAEEASKTRITRAMFDDQVVVGMTAAQVRSTWGSPDKINPSQYRAGEKKEQWVYYESDRTSYVHLTNDRVTSSSTYQH